MLIPTLVVLLFWVPPNVVSAEITVDPLDQSESLPGLPRLTKLSDRIFTGYEPTGNAGFDSLQKLGIKTIVNADGATPDIDAAKARGMRYIHIPYGYDTVPDEVQKAICKIIKECDGPFYFHCHHGQHRGPAAAAIALRADTGCDAETGLAVLTRCGTGKDYKGLWKSVGEFKPPGKDEPLPELHEISKVNDLPQAMARMDRVWDNVILLQKSDWKPPADHPDLSAEHEALILGESLRTIARLNVEKDQKQDMWLRMKETESFAFHLRDALKSGDTKQANERFHAIENNCMNCHSLYRNNIKRQIATEKKE